MKRWRTWGANRILLLSMPIAAFVLLYMAGSTRSTETDSDGDGMSDAYELFYGLNPTNPADAAWNNDDDALTNLAESIILTDPFAGDTDQDGFKDDADSNAISRAYIQWGAPYFTDGDDYSYAAPAWLLGAYKVDGAWSTNPVSWHVPAGESNAVGSLNVDLDRDVLTTNNLRYRVKFFDTLDGMMYMDLLATNGTPLVTNLFGNIQYGSNTEVTVCLDVPLAAYTNAAVIHVRRGSGETRVYESLLYVDEDGDGLDADQEAQLGTSDYSVDSDGDGLTDYDEVFVYGTDPSNADTDGDGMSDGDEVGYGRNPLLPDEYGVPFVEMFETDTVLVGPIHGQNGWEAWPTGGAFVQTNIMYEGAQALLLTNIVDVAADTQVRHLFVCSNQTVWVEMTVRTDAGAMPTGTADWATAWFFNDAGRLMVYDGLAGTNGDWVWLTNHPPYITGQWIWVMTKANYGTRQWEISLDGTLVASNLGFSAAAGGQFTELTIQGKGYADYVKVSLTPPGDSDSDGMPDWWEEGHGLDPLVNDAALDPDSDGLTNIQEYQYNTDPHNQDTDGDGLTDGGEVTQGTDPHNPDTDWDGMPDGWEVSHNLNPLVNDAALDPDSDGLTNLQEYQNGTDPHNADTDGDGIPDGWEVSHNLNPLVNDAALDPDSDGLTNLQEYQNGTDPHNADTDGDGMPDKWEVDHNLNPLVNDASLDPDSDGLTNLQEYQNGTDPHNADTDGDGMPDGWEVNHWLNPLVNDAALDIDNDGLTNLQEYQYSTDPHNQDTDGDGMSDGDEVRYGKNPLVADEYAGMPFVDMFETNTVQVGQIHGQNGWEAWPATGALVQTEMVYAGAQALFLLDNVATNSQVRHVFLCSNQTVWVEITVRTDASAMPTGTVDWATAWFFNDAGRLVVYDGLAGTNGDWVTLTNHPPYTTVQWAHVATMADYGARKWLVFLDGTLVAYNLGFSAAAKEQFTDLTMQGGGYVDNVKVSLTPPENADTDGDGMPDWWEAAHGLDPLVNDAALDSDNDGLTNLQEYQNGTDPHNADTDGDGLADGWEVTHGTNPLNTDTDGDGMPDGWEVAHGLDPLVNDADLDADNDGLTNLQESQLLVNGGMEIESVRVGLPAYWDQQWEDAETDPSKKMEAQKIQFALDRNIKTEGNTSARFTRAESGGYFSVLQQYFNTKPGQTYRLSAKVKIEDLTAQTGGAYMTVCSEAEYNGQVQIKIPPSAEGFNEYAITFTGDQNNNSSCYFLLWDSPCTIWVDDVRIEEVSAPLASGEQCLTGNYIFAPAYNLQIPGTYSLYNGDTTSFDAPAFTLKTVSPTSVVAVVDQMTEAWVYTNAVPFATGIATGQLTNGKADSLNFGAAPGGTVFHQMWWVNRTIGGTVLFDLKQDYTITRVKVQPASAIPPSLSADLSLKPATGQIFTLVGRQDGYGTALFEGLNTRARWVAVTAKTLGLSEIEIWGRTNISEGVPPVPYEWPAVTGYSNTVPEPGFTNVGIYPQPRNVQCITGMVVLPPTTPIVLCGQPSERGRLTMQTFQADLAESIGLTLPTQECAYSESNAVPDVAIRLWLTGQHSNLDSVIQSQVGGAVTNAQGYALLAADLSTASNSETGIWLAGADEAGLFYGTRALLDLLKRPGLATNLEAQAVAIRDWPRATLRGIMYTPVMNAFNDRFIRHLSRLRYNALVPLADPTAYVESLGTNAMQQLIAYCDRYFVQVIPTYCCVGLHDGMIQEKAESEPPPQGSRRTMCPTVETNRTEYLRRLDVYAPFYNSPYFNISLDEIDHYDQGSRWNCCPLCVARGLTTPVLMAEWIEVVCAHLVSLGKTPMCYASPWFSEPYQGLDELIKDDIPLMITYISTLDRRANIRDLGCQGWVQISTGTIPLQDNEIGGWIDNWSAQTAEGMAQQGKFALYVRTANGFWAMSLPPPPECEDQVGPAMARLREAVTGLRLPSLHSQTNDFIPLDISGQANEPLVDAQAGDGHGWMNEGPGRDLQSLTSGETNFYDIPFIIGEQCVMVENRARLVRVLPDAITNIPVGQKAAGIVFIHTQNQTCDLSEPWYDMMTYLGHYKIHYDDGTYVLHELRYGVNIQKWDTQGQHTYEATVAWRGLTDLGYPVTLYLDEWVNSYPEKTITNIDFCATMRPRPTRLALLAATAIQAQSYNTNAISTNWPALLTQREQTALPEGVKEIPLVGGTYQVVMDDELISTVVPKYNSVTYTAPGGILLASSNTWSRAGEPHLTQALVDNNWHWEANDCTALTVTFPAQRAIKALEIVGCYEDRRFSGLRCQDFVIETSTDGTAFSQATTITQTIAEVDGRIPVTLSGQPIKALRIIPIKQNNYQYGTVGLAYLSLFEVDE